MTKRHGGPVPGPVRQGGRDVPQGGSPEGHRRRAAHHPRQEQARQGDDWATTSAPGRSRSTGTATATSTWSSATSPARSTSSRGRARASSCPKPEEIKAGDQPLKFEGHHSDPFVIDWDGDGDLDILSGSSEGGVQWAENRAGPGKPPRLEPFRSLIERGPSIEYGQILRDADLKGPLSDTRIWVDDVNSDGKLDILVGDMTPLDLPGRWRQRGGVQEAIRRLEQVARRGEPRSCKPRRTTRRSRPKARAALSRSSTSGGAIHEGGQDGLRLAVPAEVRIGVSRNDSHPSSSNP